MAATMKKLHLQQLEAREVPALLAFDLPPMDPPAPPPADPAPPAEPPVDPPVATPAPVATTTTLTTSKNKPLGSELYPIQTGEPISFTAKVVRADGTPAAGSVKFTDNGIPIATVPLDALGTVTVTDVTPRYGARKITATFTPADAATTVGSASAALSFTVVKSSSSTALTAGMASGGKQVLTAQVTTPFAAAAIGTVTFMNGTTVLGTAKVDGAGVAKLLVTSGTYQLQAVYSGSSTVEGSQSAVVPVGGPVVPPVVPPTVAKATAVALTTPAGTVTTGNAINLRAAVTTSADGTALTPVTAGQVAFYDGSKLLGTITLGSTGQANLSTTTTALGNHDFKAVFVGTPAALAGTSNVVTVAVTKPPSKVALVTPPVATPAGKPASVQVKVSAPFGGQPIGTVAAFVNGQPTGTAAVNGNGIATLSFPTGLTAGMALRFEYGGSSVFDKSVVEVSIPSVILA